LQIVEEALGTEEYPDWNEVWERVQEAFRTLPDDVDGWTIGAKGTAQKRLFRDCFTVVDPEAMPVVAKHHKLEPPDREALFPGQRLPTAVSSVELSELLGLNAEGKKKQIEYEADPALRDTENIPLKEDIVSYFLREVRPYVADAWIDRETLDEHDGGIGKIGYPPGGRKHDLPPIQSGIGRWWG